MTAWYVASECYNLEILRKLQEWAKKSENRGEKYLLAPELKGMTVWQKAVQ
jgi:hypothetical protein